MKISSYQRLKNRIEAMREYQEKLLDNEEFYISESLIYRVQKDVGRIVMFGDVKLQQGFISNFKKE